ncbi:hypothetical protein [Pseudomonas sp. GM17]|uniref:hypothetical protein n=1 Tax=Pseudomonas sp. GM17 TaxID=1144323 RepID=UPI000272565B|nr:hypothetical protein [Pseudomonas sp. GM17]WIE52381.1 hypothetical protein PMI20_012525 [Pseudomonas sp. GM17]
MQVNQPQGGTQEAITNPFKVGDEVSYVAIKAEGHGYRFSARKGVIVEIDSQVATVLAGNGRTITPKQTHSR